MQQEMLAQVVHAIRHEMARTLNDILLRRTGLGTLGDPGDAALKSIAELASRELGWEPARMGVELELANSSTAVPE